MRRYGVSVNIKFSCPPMHIRVRCFSALTLHMNKKRSKKRARESTLIKLQRKQFKVSRGKPHIQITSTNRKNKRSIFDTTNESTIMEQGDVCSPMNTFSDGLQLSPTNPSAAAAQKKFPSRTANYYRYIKKLINHIYSNREKQITTSAIITLNDFSNQMFELLVELASEMVRATERKTLGQWDIQSATRILLSKGLAADAHAHALVALSNLEKSKGISLN